jgi:hypothetical protein
MFSEKLHKMKEEAHVGQELLDSDPLSDLDRKCVTVKQVVQEKDFTLEEALLLYQVSKSDYERFLVIYLLEELNSALTSSNFPGSSKEHLSVTIEIFSALYKRIFIGFDSNAPAILAHFDDLSKRLNEGKIAV